MKVFLRHLIRLLIPVILQALEEALDRMPVKEGQRSQNSEKAAEN